MNRTAIYLWVPINGPGSNLSLFASVILKMLRSIQTSLNLKYDGEEFQRHRMVGISTSNFHFRSRLKRDAEESTQHTTAFTLLIR